MPRISICLPVYNGADYVEDALASIAAQTCTDYVVLASDNASSDETGAILDKWSRRIAMDIVTQDETIPMQTHFDRLLDRVETEAYNMFGIPLLVRTSALGSHRYDPQFRYIVDVDLSWTISRNAPAWHIPEVMIANRYSASNSTWAMLKDASTEFMALAKKYGVALTPGERRHIGFINWYTGVQKQLFGAYERVRTRLGA